jgi:hypothetical protein
MFTEWHEIGFFPLLFLVVGWWRAEKQSWHPPDRVCATRDLYFDFLEKPLKPVPCRAGRLKSQAPSPKPQTLNGREVAVEASKIKEIDESYNPAERDKHPRGKP